MNNYFDIIIIGSGIAGLYSAYKIKQISPNTSFLILEKYKKEWIGGRTNNDTFYGEEVVTGAGIGRKTKDKLLRKIVRQFQLPSHEYIVRPQYSKAITNVVDTNNVMKILRKEYKKNKPTMVTFQQFAKPILGEKLYNDFLLSAGYTDYENEDAYETLYYYGMEDNACCWKAFTVPWKQLVMKFYQTIGEKHFKFSKNVVSINKITENPSIFFIQTDSSVRYFCNKVILATTISSVRKLLPNYPIYNDIQGQPFLRLYGKFSASSIPILKEYVKGFIFLPGSLQRMIPINPDKGIYMIAYNDNKNALSLKNNLENNEKNRNLFSRLVEKGLGIHSHSLHLTAIKDFYWPIGTHYYKPLNNKLYKNRHDFVSKAQHPDDCILVVGELVSRNQGWTEGALESVENVLTVKWVKDIC
jgi:hypothetical protein